jgi:hypothetical protein
VALILDESASINSTDIAHTRDAALAFLNALSNTRANVAIIAFARAARVGVRYLPVNSTNIGSVTNPAAGTFRNFLFGPGTGGHRRSFPHHRQRFPPQRDELAGRTPEGHH